MYEAVYAKENLESNGQIETSISNIHRVPDVLRNHPAIQAVYLTDVAFQLGLYRIKKYFVKICLQIDIEGLSYKAPMITLVIVPTEYVIFEYVCEVKLGNWLS